MGVKITDADVRSVLIDVVDEDGRTASISFDGENIVFHKRRPHQGKKAVFPLRKLLDLALLDNRRFFEMPIRPKR